MDGRVPGFFEQDVTPMNRDSIIVMGAFRPMPVYPKLSSLACLEKELGSELKGPGKDSALKTKPFSAG